jgi:hypothetical protein
VWLRQSPEWRTLVGVVVAGSTLLTLSIGLTASPAAAGVVPTAGYIPFPAVTFGDANTCSPPDDLFVNQPVVGMAATPDGKGYWLVASDGGVFNCGEAAFYGSTGAMHLNQPIVGMAATHDGQGYWLVAADGGIFSFGDAAFYGSTGAMHLNQPIVGMAATPDGKGYWLVAADGGIFSFGDAAFYGSMGGKPLDEPVVGMAASQDGKGYWLVAADGGIFSFGDAVFDGSEGGARLEAQVTAMAAAPNGQGYWLVAADGGVFAFGNAGFFGSLATASGRPWGSNGGTLIANPIVAIASSPDGQGYLLLPSPPAIRPSLPGYSGFDLAKRQYEISGSVASAYQNEPWLQAASYLLIGESVDPGNTSGYPGAIQELTQLASLPDMGATAEQRAEAVTDTNALDAFFGTPSPGN